jgi:hypothetical protein
MHSCSGHRLTSLGLRLIASGVTSRFLPGVRKRLIGALAAEGNFAAPRNAVFPRQALGCLRGTLSATIASSQKRWVINQAVRIGNGP